MTQPVRVRDGGSVRCPFCRFGVVMRRNDASGQCEHCHGIVYLANLHPITGGQLMFRDDGTLVSEPVPDTVSVPARCPECGTGTLWAIKALARCRRCRTLVTQRGLAKGLPEGHRLTVNSDETVVIEGPRLPI